ncbi:hypothetical protein [Nonomuraea gerenzanensis]|uniref:hypothetical protein n=1 Tax=Nonomuraea gerenzanensis TaxID=93944 RepID=UPI001CD9B51F|nr:hypothetical protein [Nonomuraea gerenzanensis]UBU19163.1 hypothetical protein LCN96_51045 [Nonomuraea gerenzanensis]
MGEPASGRERAADLVKNAIRMDVGTGLLHPGAVFRADRGSNCTSDEFGRFLAVAASLRGTRTYGRTI